LILEARVVANTTARAFSPHNQGPDSEVPLMKLLLTVCAVALVALAAPANAAKMYGGVKAGANFGTLVGDDALDNSERSAFQGGVFIGTHVNERFGFRVEGLYVMKGAEGSLQVEDGDIHDAAFKLAYIDFPLLFVFDAPAGETLAFNFFAGPTLGFNISAKADVAEHGEEELDNVASFEFGAAIGAGIEKKMSGASLLLDVRYSFGATSIAEDVAGQSVDIKNRGIGVMAGLSFPFGSQQ
jgi:hypothetical protein